MEKEPTGIETTNQAVFIHRCCNDGYKFFKQFSIEHSEVVVKTISMLNARDMKLPEKYGFNLNDLHSCTFIWYENKLLKGNI